jgi:hypothetical protein
MTDSLKVLGQVLPSAGVLTTAYTVPASTSTTVSSLVICNVSASSEAFRVSVAIAGAADTLAQYLYYDVFLDVADTFIATVGLSLATTDVIRVRSASGGVAFSIFGVEIT